MNSDYKQINVFLDRKKLFSLFMIGIGIMLLYTGYQNYRVFSTSFNPLFNVSLDSDIKAQFIFGVAALISGFVGFIRERVIKPEL